MGMIGKNDFIYGVTNLGLDFSAFELNKLLNFLDLENFSKVTRNDWKKKLNKFMKINKINILHDFGLNILCKIKYLIDIKRSNLLEIFRE